MAHESLIDGSPTDGVNPWIDSLVWGGRWIDADGGKTTIGYALREGYDDYSEAWGAPWRSSESAALSTAMAQWANVANLEFVATGSDHSDIWYWVVDDATATSLFGPGILGIHEVPGYSDGLPLYGAFNNGGEGWTDAGLTIGGLGFATLIHELGHGLGLAHPHDGGDAPDASLFPGVTSEFDDYGDYDLNQGIWTTMSYNDGWPSAFPSPSHDFGHQLTPMALDIAAIQLIYGANTTYKSGDDLYLLPSANAVGSGWSCIWDAGGTDTISAATAARGCTINLRFAPLSGANAGGYVSFTSGVIGGFTIANGVVIENAIGSAFADQITGNESENTLEAAGGNDSISGLGGNDTLIGNAGNDTLIGDAGNDSLVGGLGDDVYLITDADAGDVVVEAAAGGTDRVDTYLASYTLSAEVEHLNYIGAGHFTGNGQGLNNRLTSDAGNDSLSGLAGNDTLIGNAGNDTLDGGLGNDSLVGGAGDDVYRLDVRTDAVTESATEGTDRVDLALSAGGTYTLTANVEHAAIVNAIPGVNLIGNTENNQLTGNAQANSLSGLAGYDTLDGAAGDDNLDGGTGNDSLLGGLGDDTLIGGTGNDTLQGNEGNDLYLVDSALDVVNEAAGQGLDRVDTALASHTLSADVENLTYTGALAFAGTGNAVNNSLIGAAGNDTLSGEAGDDTLIGNAGNDTLNGGTGNDSLVGGLGDDVYLVTEAGDVVVEAVAGGKDRVDTDLASYSLGAEVEHLSYTGGSDFTGNGQALNNRLTGNAGNDTLNGGPGSDTLVGGSGDDEYQIDVGSDVVNEGLGEGIDLVQIAFTSTGSYTLTAHVENALVTSPGDSFAVHVTGNALANTLTGHAGANSLIGRDGNDTLDGRGGSDTLDGGLGSDTAILAGVLNDYAISRPSTTQTSFTHLPSGHTVLISHIEFITFTGDASSKRPAELIARISSPGKDTLIGTGGDDTLAGALGNDSLIGGFGNDDLQGGDGIDTLAGGAGNDTLDGGAGNDTYQFAIGGGDDLIDQNDPLAGSLDTVELASPIGDLSTGETTLTRDRHSDDDLLITVTSGADGAAVVDHLVVHDFFSNDLVNLGGAIDQIRFLSNGSVLTQAQILAELLKGTSGDDWLRGYANTSDSIAGGAGNDTLGGAAGNDTLSGGLGNDSLSGDAGADLLDGGASDDQVSGGDGNDTLSGSGGNDTISGGAGDDTLSGGDGADQLSGGDGADRFVFDTADALVHADLITDFVSGVDRIALKASVFTGLGNAGDTVGLSDYLTYDSGTGALAYDADGVGGADAVTFATLGAGTHPATLGMDFLVV
jgi:Ca2+-binding RTX toxin-like protein